MERLVEADAARLPFRGESFDACLAPRSRAEATPRPCVVRDSDGYRMWYCYRCNADYGTNPGRSCRIGHAESKDRVSWERMAQGPAST